MVITSLEGSRNGDNAVTSEAPLVSDHSVIRMWNPTISVVANVDETKQSMCGANGIIHDVPVTHTIIFSSSFVLPQADAIYSLWFLAVRRTSRKRSPSRLPGSSGFTDGFSRKNTNSLTGPNDMIPFFLSFSVTGDTSCQSLN